MGIIGFFIVLHVVVDEPDILFDACGMGKRQIANHEQLCLRKGQDRCFFLYFKRSLVRNNCATKISNVCLYHAFHDLPS